MAFVIARQKVKDYQKWKRVFDSTLVLRKTSGEKSCRVFRSSDDLNEVIVLSEWDDLRNAVKYSQNKLFKEAAQEAGILARPVIYMPEEGFGA